jgi:hypothetical protein
MSLLGRDGLAAGRLRKISGQAMHDARMGHVGEGLGAGHSPIAVAISGVQMRKLKCPLRHLL